MRSNTPETLIKRKENFTQHLVDRIEHTYIENEDALKILYSRNVKNAFHYIDPPYPNTDQGHYAGYTFEDYERLLNFCADDCKGKFLLSSYNSEMLDHFTKVHGWHKKEINLMISGSRSLNSRKGRNQARTEVLVSNYKSACGTIELFK